MELMRNKISATSQVSSSEEVTSAWGSPVVMTFRLTQHTMNASRKGSIFAAPARLVDWVAVAE